MSIFSYLYQSIHLLQYDQSLMGNSKRNIEHLLSHLGYCIQWSTNDYITEDMDRIITSIHHF